MTLESKISKSECPLCEKGEISFDLEKSAYLCNSCDYEMGFGLEKGIPPYMKGKKVLGSFISYSGKSSFWKKLMHIHKKISIEGEYERRREHFESEIERKKSSILKYWDNSINGNNFDNFKKSELVFEMADSFGTSKSLVCEVLKREDRWNYGSFSVWNYMLTKKYSAKVKEMWQFFGGEDVAKTGNSSKTSKVVDKISKKLSLSPYNVTAVLNFSDIWSGGNWQYWNYKKAEEYGSVLIKLWENRREKAKSKWDLCEVIESISNDTGINGFLVLNVLETLTDISISPKEASLVFSKYIYANKAHEIIKNKGVVDRKDISEEFEIGSRHALASLNFLAENTDVEIYSGLQRKKYFYLDKKALKEKSPEIGLEEILFSKPFKTRDIVEKGKVSLQTALNLSKKWEKEGKINVIKRTGRKGNLYVPK